jgi:hypothetical protein
MPGVTELLDNAIERGQTFESMGAGKASKGDLTHYVIEIADEVEAQGEPDEQYSDPVIAAALFRIWTTE